MQIDANTALLEQAEFIASPNFDDYPNSEDISLLVIHNISLPENDFSSDDVILFFTNQLPIAKDPFYKKIKNVKVSAHLFIRRDGRVIQFVPFNKRAWHAGVSEFAGRQACNDFSLGIELEGVDNIAFTEAQYESLATVSKALLKKYPKITMERIVGHSDIAPGRKTDPGPSFSWQKYKHLLD